MVPLGQLDLHPQLNAIQALIAVKHDGTWRTVLFGRTLAQFHSRPEMVQQLTDEIRQSL